MTQSSLEVLCKQIPFFVCRDALFAQKICLKGMLKIPCPSLVVSLLGFSRDMREVRTHWTIVYWLLNPSVYCEPTFSIPDTFQVQIITEIYDETRVNRRIKAKLGFSSSTSCHF